MPSTEKQPFVAQAQAMGSRESRARRRMPIGNNIPIRNASGKMARTAITMRAPSESAIAPAKSGVEPAA
jgi:hypothetical protein